MKLFFYSPRENADALIIEQLLALKKEGKNEAVTQIIRMAEDVIAHGQESRFLKKLKDLPITELKTRTRGGVKGGARAYGFFTASGFVLVSCEAKVGSQPSEARLMEVIEAIEAWENDEEKGDE